MPARDRGRRKVKSMRAPAAWTRGGSPARARAMSRPSSATAAARLRAIQSIAT